jgi:DNA polymerase-3 subunit beta
MKAFPLPGALNRFFTKYTPRTLECCLYEASWCALANLAPRKSIENKSTEDEKTESSKKGGGDGAAAGSEKKDIARTGARETIDTLIPRKTLAELTKLTANFDDEISLGMDENHIYFQIGPRLLISRMLYGQFPNYEMVMPKNNDKSVEFNSSLLNHAIRRVALMADERSHAIRFHLEPNQLVISSQNAEEGEANETLQTDYAGEATDIGFNAQYLQEFLNVIGDAKVAFEFKDGNSQAQLKPSENGDYDYKYIVMPMRI